jgi:hypothetical protein
MTSSGMEPQPPSLKHSYSINYATEFFHKEIQVNNFVLDCEL